MEGSDNSDLDFNQKGVETTPYYTPNQKPSLPESGPEPVNIDFSSPDSGIDSFGASMKEEPGSSSSTSSDSETDSFSLSGTDIHDTPANTDEKGLPKGIKMQEFPDTDAEQHSHKLGEDKTDSILMGQNRNYEELLSKFNKTEEELKVSNLKLSLSEQEILQLKDELDSVQKELKVKVNDLECENGQVLELQKQTAELETHVPDCCNKIANLVEQLEAAKEQLKTSNDELVRLREELQSRSSDTHELQAQLEVAKENTATLECQLGSRRKQILQLEGRISCYKANETKHARAMQKLKDEMLTSKAQITWERDQMQANIHSLSAIQKEMGSTLRECEARGDLLQKQLIQFETEKLKEEEQHATEKMALQGEISCLKEELGQRRHDVEAVNMEFDKHKQKYDMLTTERDEANAKIDKLMAELSFRDNQITEGDRELSQLRAQNAELISVSETRKNLIDELKMNVEELEKEVTMQKVVISDRDEEKREAIRQLCISLEHYRNGYKELLQAFIGFRRHHAVIAS
ncbi:protein NETWORKED 4B [Arachis duranensis]|uniref:protein NETWORKED 4B n=1 Tax=Arachis duranensis TaxID=130453 RepID=A0A6P4BN70_ARADU|nr:protein NETWORKED 4B [Arachis duranensis]